MSKKLKWGAIIGGSTFIVFLILVFVILSLPAGGSSREKQISYVKETQEQVSKINVPSNIKKEGDRFVQSFFLFKPEQLKENTKYSLAFEECRKLSVEYGQGSNVHQKLIDATKDSYGNHLLTYDVSGVYKKEEKAFSIVLTLTNTNGEARVSNYSVVHHE